MCTITVLYYVATCSQHTHVTNRNNPELKTLIQKHLHLTRYAPALYVNETETLLSVLNMYRVVQKSDNPVLILR